MRGIIYIMTTAVSGLIKIGQTGIDNYQERMRFLEANGYYNVSGLKRFFAIELTDYKEKEFDEVAKAREQGALFTFYKKGIKDGEEIVFIADKEVSAKVVGEREVEYGGQIWKLSPLTRKIYEDRGEVNSSGAYQGAAYWEYEGKKLKDLPDKN